MILPIFTKISANKSKIDAILKEKGFEPLPADYDPTYDNPISFLIMISGSKLFHCSCEQQEIVDTLMKTDSSILSTIMILLGLPVDEKDRTRMCGAPKCKNLLDLLPVSTVTPGNGTIASVTPGNSTDASVTPGNGTIASVTPGNDAAAPGVTPGNGSAAPASPDAAPGGDGFVSVNKPAGQKNPDENRFGGIYDKMITNDPSMKAGLPSREDFIKGQIAKLSKAPQANPGSAPGSGPIISVSHGGKRRTVRRTLTSRE